MYTCCMKIRLLKTKHRSKNIICNKGKDRIIGNTTKIKIYIIIRKNTLQYHTLYLNYVVKKSGKHTMKEIIKNKL